MVKDYLTLKK